MTDCPGPCNAAHRRATTNGEDPGHAQPGEPVWCHRDQARIRQRLTDTQTLAALLEHTTDGYGEAPGERTRASNGHPPSPSPGFDTLDEIERMFREWEASYLDVKKWGSPPVHGRWASVSYECYVFLAKHFAGIMESPFAREFGDEVLSAARELALKAKAGSGYKRGRVPCPRCHELFLFSTDAGHVYWCAQCGRPVRKDEYDELCTAATPRPVARA